MRIVAVMIVACALAASGFPAEAEGKDGSLRIGLMPAYNSIPLVAAAAAGLYEANGVSVQLVPFNGQLEREAALQAGALDGTVSDLINAIQAWSHGGAARVTSVTEGRFSLLAAPGSRMATLADWPTGSRAPVRTGLLANSIVFFLTERMLTAGGADPGKIELVPIVQLPARLEMLLAGRVEAACLPEPLASLAVSRGAHALADSDRLGTTPGVLLFTARALREKQPQLRAFYRAYDAAVDELAARPLAHRTQIITGCGFPPAAAVVMEIPRFRHRFLPSESLVSDVSAWMIRTGLLVEAPTYSQIVAPQYGCADARAP